MTYMDIEGKPVYFQVDTGATCNILRKTDLPPGVAMRPGKVTLSYYNGETEPSAGECELKVTNPRSRQQYTLKFVVVERGLQPILGLQAAQDLGLIKLLHENLASQPFCAAVDSQSQTDQGKTKLEFIEKFPSIFEKTVGVFQGTLHVEVTADAKTVQST